MIIAIEGMDGVGKTTIAKRIEKELNYAYVEKPLHYLLPYSEQKRNEELKDILTEMYKLDDFVVKAWMIGLGNIYSCRCIENKNIVLDRHLVSNYFWNGNPESKAVFKTMIELIGVPDITFLLYASDETRKCRLEQRNKNDRDIYDPEMWVDGYKKMESFLKEFNIPYILVNTDDKNIEQVYDEIQMYIQKNNF